MTGLSVSRPALAVAAAAAVAGVALLWRREAAPWEAFESGAEVEGPAAVDPVPAQSAWIDDQGDEDVRDESQGAAGSAEGNADAFLEAIAWAEGTTRRADPYRVCYGYRHTIRDFAQHPAISGEWRGERLSDAMCDAAGVPRGSVSTAAGKFQITRTTWRLIHRSRADVERFDATGQRFAALRLLRDCGALLPAQRGQFAEAVRLSRRIWASLPGSGWRQPERALGDVRAAYLRAGGVVLA